MHVFEMVVLIVLIGGITSIVSKFLERKEKRLPKWMTDVDWTGEGDEYDENGEFRPVSLARIEKLEERVAVLEKIVTDQSYDLKKEFDNL